MGNFTVTPNMALNNPTPGVDPGEDYAFNIQAALNKIDAHTHTGASVSDGLQIPSAGINFNADLSAQSNNLTNLRSTRFANQSSTLSGVGDVDCVYVSGNNLYFNNGSGTAVQLTAGSTPFLPSSTSYTVVSTAVNLTINASDATTLVRADPTSGAIIISLPGASTVSTGRFYLIKDRTGQSQTHNITISPAGADTIDGNANYVMKDNFTSIAVVSDGVSNWMLFVYQRKIFFSGETVSFTGGAQLTTDVSSPVSFGGTLSVTGVATLFSTLNFDKTAAFPLIKQNTATSGNGLNLTLQAQSASAAATTGGNLVLQSGAGTANPGAVQLYSGATLAMQINGPFIGANVNLLQSTLQFDPSVSAPIIQQGTQTSNAATNNLTIAAQAPFASATGTNRNPGQINLSLAAPTGGGTVRGQVNIVDNSNAIITMFADASQNGYIDTVPNNTLNIRAFGNARIALNSTGIGFFGATPIAKPSITGALSSVTDANAKTVITSIITALSNYGLATNSTT